MKNIVYFLGAGASKNFGYPLTAEIMPQILQKLKENSLFKNKNNDPVSDKEQEDDLLRFIYRLYPGLEDIDIQNQAARIPNITEVLSMVDHCCIYNNPPHPELSDARLLRFRELLNRAVGELLMEYERQPYTKNEHDLLQKFIEPIRELKRNYNVSIITTNYDLIIDSEFRDQMGRNEVDFGILYRQPSDSRIMLQPNAPLFRYYKLHGSLNWLRCDLCGHVYINTHGSIIHNAFRDELVPNNTCVCSTRLRLKSVLVTPSLVRDIRDSNLLQIWKSATEAVRTADKLVMIGYSMPGEDLAIKSILMKGYNGRLPGKPLTIDVVQYGDAARHNYENLFGARINYYGQGLEHYLNNIMVLQPHGEQQN